MCRSGGQNSETSVGCQDKARRRAPSALRKHPRHEPSTMYEKFFNHINKSTLPHARPSAASTTVSLSTSGTTCFWFHMWHMAADVHRQLNIEAMILTRNVCAYLCGRCININDSASSPRRSRTAAPPRSPRAWSWHFSSGRLPGGVFHLSRAMAPCTRRVHSTGRAGRWGHCRSSVLLHVGCCALPHTLTITSNH